MANYTKIKRNIIFLTRFVKNILFFILSWSLMLPKFELLAVCDNEILNMSGINFMVTNPLF